MDVASQASTALSGKTIQKQANFRSFQLNYSIVVPSDLLCGKSLEGSITTKPQVQLRNRVRNWAPSFCSQEWHRSSCLLLLGLLCWFHFLFWTVPRILLTSSLPDLIGSHRLTTFCFQGLPNCYLSPDLPPAFQTCLFNCLLHLSAQMALWHLERRTCRTDPGFASYLTLLPTESSRSPASALHRSHVTHQPTLSIFPSKYTHPIICHQPYLGPRHSPFSPGSRP